MRPLGVAHALDDDLLGCLRGDTTEINVFNGLLVIIARLQCGIDLGRLFGRELRAQQRQLGVGYHQPTSGGDVITGLAIDHNLNVCLFVVALLCGRRQGQLDGLKDNVFRYAFLGRNCFSNHQNFFVHRFALVFPDSSDSARLSRRFALVKGPLSSLFALTDFQSGIRPGAVYRPQGQRKFLLVNDHHH